MSIARWAVNRPVAVVMRIAALVLLGVVCYFRLPVDLLPKVSLPTVGVVTTWQNVAPEEIETQVTRPIEEALSSVYGLYHISSSSTEGVSTVRVRFRWGTDIGQAAVDTLQLVERARRNFPNDPTLGTPTVFKADPSQLPILIFGVSGINDSVQLRTVLDNQVVPIVESADGVASAVTTGGDTRSIMVSVDPDKLRAHHVSLADVMRRLVNENVNLPAGIAKQGRTEYLIRSSGWFKTTEEIARLPLGVFDGHNVLLSDVAEVRDLHDETRIYTRLNGQPAAGLIITKQSEVNTVSTARSVFEKLEQVRKIYPELKFGLAYDQSRFISDSVDEVKRSALIGGILAVLIILFFLRNIRSTLVVALSIPTSIISTFALLYICGFTLNTMSLGGLALATGLIVDDAVVVLENIFRHIERDRKTAVEAAVSGTNEILSAVIASTWTVMVVFLPLLLIKGQAGQMYTQFALVVIFSLAVSLLDATTVVPMLSTKLISGEAHRESLSNGSGERGSLLDRAFRRAGEWFEVLDSTYRNGLRWAIHHRLYVITGALAVTGLSFLLLPWIGTELMPATDSGDFNISIKLPVGTALSETDRVIRQVEEIVRDNPNVMTVFAAAGSSLSMRGTSTAQVPYRGALQVKLKDDRRVSTQSVIRDLRRKIARIPGVRPQLTQYDVVSNIMSGGNQNIEIDIFGNDLSTLTALSKQVMARISGTLGLENVDVNWEEAMPEIQWTVDREKALQMGVSFAEIASTINTATNGSLSSYYREKGYQYPITVNVREDARKTITEIANLVVKPGPPGSTGQDILLGQLATPSYGVGPSQISRLDRQRYIAVQGVPQGRSAGEVQVDVEKAMEGLQLPQGYYWDWGLNQKQRNEEFSGMWVAVLLAIGLIYMLLAAQFESYVHPFTILLSVPLAATGVLLGLFLTGRSFGLTAFIGVLMLVGIVVKNGILLVDYTNQLRDRGLSRTEALLRAGPTRLRPILMTASAAMLGMLPLALGLGSGSEVQAPMATAVIGGLFTSTLLTLFVVPTVYTAIDDLMQFHGRRKEARNGD